MPSFKQSYKERRERKRGCFNLLNDYYCDTLHLVYTDDIEEDFEQQLAYFLLGVKELSHCRETLINSACEWFEEHEGCYNDGAEFELFEKVEKFIIRMKALKPHEKETEEDKKAAAEIFYQYTGFKKPSPECKSIQESESVRAIASNKRTQEDDSVVQSNKRAK